MKLERLLAVITCVPVTCREPTPFAEAALSTVNELFKLSTSEAEEDGDSPRTQ